MNLSRKPADPSPPSLAPPWPPPPGVGSRLASADDLEVDGVSCLEMVRTIPPLLLMWLLRATTLGALSTTLPFCSSVLSCSKLTSCVHREGSVWINTFCEGHMVLTSMPSQ